MLTKINFVLIGICLGFAIVYAYQRLHPVKPQPTIMLHYDCPQATDRITKGRAWRNASNYAL